MSAPKHTPELEPEPRYWVRCTDPDGSISWCLCWGDKSPRWEGSRENAEDRAAKMTATSSTGATYTAIAKAGAR